METCWYSAASKHNRNKLISVPISPPMRFKCLFWHQMKSLVHSENMKRHIYIIHSCAKEGLRFTFLKITPFLFRFPLPSWRTKLLSNVNHILLNWLWKGWTADIVVVAVGFLDLLAADVISTFIVYTSFKKIRQKRKGEISKRLIHKLKLVCIKQGGNFQTSRQRD